MNYSTTNKRASSSIWLEQSPYKRQVGEFESPLAHQLDSKGVAGSLRSIIYQPVLFMFILILFCISCAHNVHDIIIRCVPDKSMNIMVCAEWNVRRHELNISILKQHSPKRKVYK